MTFLLGTDDGVFEADGTDFERVALAGRRVTHLARRAGVALAALPRDGVFALEGGREQRIWEGDARSVALGPDGACYIGAEPAMVFRSAPGAGEWQRCDAIEALPTRAQWSFPLPPHHPHVLSIDFLPEDPASVIAGVEVGGVLLSRDFGQSWCERNTGIYEDVHSVRPAPGVPGLLLATTGRGVYASEDTGASWTPRMSGVDSRYTVGLHQNPARPREALLTAGADPSGMPGRVYHTLDAGLGWREVTPETETCRMGVPFFALGSAWLARKGGELHRSDDPRRGWKLVGRLPVAIHCAAAEGSPSSVMH